MRPARPWTRWIALGAVVLALGIGVKIFFFPSTRLLVRDARSASSPRWSPRGDRFAFLLGGGDKTALCVYEIKKHSFREVARLAYGWSGAFAWSPDGAKIAYVSLSEDDNAWGEAVYVTDADGSHSQRLAQGSDPTWAPDGTSLAMNCAPSFSATAEVGDSFPRMQGPAVCLVNAVNGTVTRIFDGTVTHLTFAPSQSTIAFEMSAPDAAATEPAAEAAASSAHPDGELVALADGAIAGQPQNVIQGSQGLSRELEARQYDRKRESEPGAYWMSPSNVYVMSANGGTPVALTSDSHSAMPRWTADGRILFVTQRPGAPGLQMWTMNPDGSDERPLLKKDVAIGDPETVTLTPDRSRVLFVSPVKVANEGVAKLMTGEAPLDLFMARVSDGKTKRLENRHSFKQRFSLSPDGKRIVYEVRNMDTKTSELWIMSL